MSIDPQFLRLEGVYAQRQQGFYMQRIKLPAGVISAAQATRVAEVADRFARGKIHLTTRGSIELHWLAEEDLPSVARQLAAVGLNGRGACGGAVRGVVCNSLATATDPRLEGLVRKIHRYFSGNPRFEQLPKKFKIAVEADTRGGRHLVQDLTLIPSGSGGECRGYDVWTAGGLGREPQAAFLLTENVPEDKVLPLIEAVLRLYAARTAAGKRLKHLLREIGQEEFRALVMAETAVSAPLVQTPLLAEYLLPEPASPPCRLEAGVFAGELTGSELLALAAVAARWAGGIMLISGEQNIVLHLPANVDPAEAGQELVYAGFAGTSRAERVAFRVCPGAHECRAGLAATRDLAAEIVELLGPAGMKKSWALSGCHNCCTRPQLADVGIFASRLVTGEGEREPRFDLLRGDGSGSFALTTAQGLTREELLQAVAAIG
jgi:ferredoxin-nitrite reductase